MAAPQDRVPHGRIRRTMPLAGFTARAAGGAMVAALREKTGDTGARARFHERTAERYAQLFGHSKGVLMKAAQQLAMLDTGSIGSGDFSPYQQALARLQADAPPMHPELAQQIVHADLGRPVDVVFTEFSDEPLAAASIGQVHRAVLPDGRQVAVKIQYPGVAEAIRDDLANTELLVAFFQFAASTVGTALQPDLLATTREFSARILEEVDYRHEAANITAFSDLYRGHPFIRVPEVIAEASGDRVLTMTYLDGMDWIQAQQADQELRNTWAEVIHRFVLGSIQHANMFHADPHPGNYRFGLDGSVGFVDFGCVTVLSERRRHRFIELMRAAIDGRKHDLRRLMVETGYFPSESTLTADEAYQVIAELAYEWIAPQPVTYTHDTMRRAIHAMLDIRSPDHPVRRMSLPDDFVFLPRANLMMNPILANLGATIYARSIMDDQDGIAEPITALGKQHIAWVRQRGLPYGLQSHDHP
ncbi:ABC1 kinase family protein [Mycolicibacterium moriokaense]|uniref:ABC1 family protein n=1 Tax=Mycolicibacterium moriokaense TaxID=39691 RepID=A0A318HCN1_9MYCO|nr:AarF/ABC1/UbiB kinase family protein [Mycolicibacterium moriokaense]PXX06283.1 ABC1 family protein [Mycolicibacterium moriokaense]